jgi:hypothetical protein
MRSKQTGVTLIGWLILLTPWAVVGYIGLRVAPVYLNFMKVAKTLEQLKVDMKGSDPGSAAVIKLALEKNLYVQAVEYPDAKDIQVTRNGRSWIVDAAYDDQAPLFSNIFILVTFDKKVTLGSESAE